MENLHPGKSPTGAEQATDKVQEILYTTPSSPVSPAPTDLVILPHRSATSERAIGRDQSAAERFQ